LPEELHEDPYFILHATTKDGKTIGSEETSNAFRNIVSISNIMRDIFNEKLMQVNDALAIDNFAAHAKRVFRNG